MSLIIVMLYRLSNSQHINIMMLLVRNATQTFNKSFIFIFVYITRLNIYVGGIVSRIYCISTLIIKYNIIYLHKPYSKNDLCMHDVIIYIICYIALKYLFIVNCNIITIVFYFIHIVFYLIYFVFYYIYLM